MGVNGFLSDFSFSFLPNLHLDLKRKPELRAVIKDCSVWDQIRFIGYSSFLAMKEDVIADYIYFKFIIGP